MLQETHPADFDGHTSFSDLTPRERLEWLDAAVTFIETQRKRRSQQRLSLLSLRAKL